jgi:solute carrier family 38 (sodium-coupled neutral amino acid transporter), member 11
MLGRRGRQNGHIDGDNQPLLDNSHEDLSTTTNNVVFACDDDDEQETSALEETHPRRKEDHSVRFQEEVQVIAPRLRSTLESREAGMSRVSVLASPLKELSLTRI